MFILFLITSNKCIVNSNISANIFARVSNMQSNLPLLILTSSEYYFFKVFFPSSKILNKVFSVKKLILAMNPE